MMIALSVAFLLLLPAVMAAEQAGLAELGLVSAGSALSFDGSDRVVIPHAQVLSFDASSEMTAELWLNPTTQPAIFHVLGKRESCEEVRNNYQLARDPPSRFSLNSGGDVISLGEDLPVGVWTHVAVTYDGSLLRFYVNGDLRVTSPFVLKGANIVPLTIGSSGSCCCRLIGQLDEVRIWRAARSADEIRFAHNRSIHPATAGLVGYWKFDEDPSVQVVIDSSPFGNAGTLGDSAQVGSDDPTRVPSSAPVTAVTHDVTVEQILEPGSSVRVGTEIRPAVRVRNLGSVAEDVQVSFAIGVDYYDTTSVVLEPGQVERVEFLPWSPERPESFGVSCEARVGEDEFASNNKKDSAVTAVADPEAPTISGLTPSSGGDTGYVTVEVHGSNFQMGARVLLFGQGGEQIVGQSPRVSADGRSISVLLDLTDRSRGLWDVLVTNPSGGTAARLAGFTLEAGRAPRLWVGILGRPVARMGRRTTYAVSFRNDGNIDAVAVPLRISGIPRGASWELLSQVIDPPNDPNVPPIDYGQVPVSIDTGTEVVLPLVLPYIPPGQAGYVLFSVAAPSTTPFELHVDVGEPLGAVNLASNATDCFVSLVSTGLACFGVPIDSACVSAIAEIGIEKIFEMVSLTRELNTEHPGETVISLVKVLLSSYASAASLFKECADIYDLPTRWLPFVLCGVGVIDTLSSCVRAWVDFRNARLEVEVVASDDPNDKFGFQGAGSPRYVAPGVGMSYVIKFVNHETATAPAQEVVVDDFVDSASIDLNSITLGPILFGQTIVVPPAGARVFATTVDLRPQKDLLVRVRAVVEGTGHIRWQMTAIDPVTGLPPEDPLLGVLPANMTPPEGEGEVHFSAMPNASLPDGATVSNVASITFDTNAPILTQVWSNTIDGEAPQSEVVMPSRVIGPQFKVSWSGTDKRAGVDDCTIYVARDQGPYAPWLIDATVTSALFAGQRGSSYAFYSICRDLVGNVESTPESPDAVVAVSGSGTR